MAKFTKTNHPKGPDYYFYCPGCKCQHGVWTNDNPNYNGSRWDFNGDMERPTLTPSLLVNPGGMNPGQPICHSFVTAGKIQFLNDCTHELAGQTVEMQNVE